MSTTYSVGLMNQLGDALEAAGYSPGDVTELRSKIPQLREFKGVLAGTAEIVVVRHVIDFDANPFVPEGWTVEEHIRGGQPEWDPTKVALYLSEGQQDGKWIRGHQLREELKGKPVYNANLLDYLLAHPELIQKEWKGKPVFFWGTIYRSPDGNLHVRSLDWRGDGWFWDFRWLGSGFHGSRPAAVPAST
jgi:hypothetical protein